MEYEEGYVYKLMDKGDPTDIREPYFKEAVNEMHESIEVIINGDKATIIGKTKTLASPFGFGKSWWRLRQDVLLEKVNDTWIIKQSKASAY